MGTSSTRAKWRALRSARVTTLKKCLTPPTLSERPVGNSSAAGRCILSQNSGLGVCLLYKREVWTWLEAINEDCEFEFRYGRASGRSVATDDDCRASTVNFPRSR